MAKPLVDDDLLGKFRFEAAKARAEQAAAPPDEVGSNLERFEAVGGFVGSRTVVAVASVTLAVLVAAIVFHDARRGGEVSETRAQWQEILRHVRSKRGVPLSRLQDTLVGPAVVSTRPTVALAARRNPGAQLTYEFRWHGWLWDRTVTAYAVPPSSDFAEPRVIAID